jgi:hypothetical protein
MKEVSALTAGHLLPRLLAPDAREAIEQFALVITRRLDLGDRSAWSYYEPIAVGTQPDTFERPQSVLAPLWVHADSAEANRIAARLFLSKDSRWRLQSPLLSDNVNSPLLRLPAFREAVVQGLQDLNHYGTGFVNGSTTLSVNMPQGGHWINPSDMKSDPLLPKPGTRFEIRLADRIAQEISDVVGAPKFRLYWPENARDAALPKIIEFVSGLSGKLDKVVKAWAYPRPEF